ITIGNFSDTAHTNKIQVSYSYWSYYEVDDVSVIATGAHAYAGPDVNLTIGHSTYIGVQDSNGDGMPCYWYILGNVSPIDSGGRILVHPLDTTTYIVAMNLCGTVTYDTVTVFVATCHGAPVVSFTDTPATGHTVSYTYTGTTYSMDSVKWNFGDGHTDTVLNPVHTFTASGTYHVCVTVYTYCGSDSACSEVVVGIPLLATAGRDNVQVWPNPVSNELTVENAAGSEMRVYDVVGREVYKTFISSEKESVHIGFLERGVYVLQIIDPSTGERVVKKVVKE
ncbi:MAG: PKD domain-containing protein, partial [Chitinophagales bacterium]